MTAPSRHIEGLAGDLARGVSLPASWYTDPAVVTRERERIFRRAWQYVGHARQVAAVGDYFTGSVGDIGRLGSRPAAGPGRAARRRAGAARGLGPVSPEAGAARWSGDRKEVTR